MLPAESRRPKNYEFAKLQNSEVLFADLKNRELAEMIMSSSTTRSSKYGCRRQVRRAARRAFATSSPRLPQILSACWNASADRERANSEENILRALERVKGFLERTRNHTGDA